MVRHQAGFRDQKIAASWKQAYDESCDGRDRGFRDQKIAASLKLTAQQLDSCTRFWFPRSKDRGLIEALCSLDRVHCPVCFRDQKIAASLKRHARIDVRPGTRSFRDQKIAASLKPYGDARSIPGRCVSAIKRSRPH